MEKIPTIRKPGSRLRISDIVIITLLILLALLIIYPFYNAILISLVPQNDYVRSPLMLFPERVIFDSYRYVLNSRTTWSGFAVTTFVTVVGTAYSMILTVLTAYVLTKKFPGRGFIMWAIIFTMYFSGGLIPYYLLVTRLGLSNSLFSMILPSGIEYTYMIIIMRYMESLPADLEEAAEIDGASKFKVLFMIVLPLSLPILATYTLYFAVDRWNEWWNAMLFIKSSHLQPLQLVLRNLIQDSSTAMADAQLNDLPRAYAEGIKMASIVVTMLPIMFLYPFLQRYFLSGLTIGAVKG